MAANDGRFDDAERFFKIVLNDNQESASAWSNLGNVHLSLGRPKDATREFTKAIALAPQVMHVLLFVVFLKRGCAYIILSIQKRRTSGEAQKFALRAEALFH